VESRTHRFPVAGEVPAIEVRNLAGTVTVEGREGVDDIAVDIRALDSAAEQLLDRVDLFFTAGRLRIVTPERRMLRTPQFAITVTTPPDAAVRVATGSADTALRGRLGEAELTSASGDITVEQCAALQLRTASGDTRIGRVAGRVTAGSASGDLRVDVAAGLTSRTASGDVSAEEVSGDVSVTTASGDVSLGRVGEGAVDVKTVSGDCEVGVVPGLRVWMDLSSISGRMDSQLTEDDGAAGDGPAQLSLTLRSVSGDLRIRRVATAG
jgi:hypothetical protein